MKSPVHLLVLGLFVLGCGREVKRSEAPAWRIEMEALSQAYFTGEGLDDQRRRRLSLLLEFAGNAPAQADLVDGDWATPAAQRAMAWRGWAQRHDDWADRAKAAASMAPEHPGCWALSVLAGVGPPPCTGPKPATSTPAETSDPYVLRDGWAWAEMSRPRNAALARAFASAWTQRWPNDPNAWFAHGLSTRDAFGSNAASWMKAIAIRPDHGPSREALTALALSTGHWRAALGHLDAASAGRESPASQRHLRAAVLAIPVALSLAPQSRSLDGSSTRVLPESREGVSEAPSSTRVEIVVDEKGTIRLGGQGTAGDAPVGDSGRSHIHVFGRAGDLVLSHPIDAKIRVAGYGGAPTPEVAHQAGQRTLRYRAADAQGLAMEPYQPALETFAARVEIGPKRAFSEGGQKTEMRFTLDLRPRPGRGLGGTLRITGADGGAERLQRVLENRREGSVASWLESRLRAIWPDIAVDQVKLTAVGVGQLSLEGEITLSAEAQFEAFDTLSSVFGGVSLSRLLSVTPRRTPLSLRGLDEVFVLRLEPSLVGEQADTWTTFESKSRFGHLAQSWQRLASGVEFTRRISFNEGVVDPGDYPDFSHWLIEGHRSMSRPVAVLPWRTQP